MAPTKLDLRKVKLEPSDDGGWFLMLDGKKQLPAISYSMGLILSSVLDEIAMLKGKETTDG